MLSTQRQRTLGGQLAVLAALGMLVGLMASEVRGISSWAEATDPKFISAFMGHFSTVVAAFIAGRLLPQNRNNRRTRSDD